MKGFPKVTMDKKEVKTKRAPTAIGPYSQALRAGNFVFISGQIPLDPCTGEVTTGGIGEQTRRVLENLRALLEEEGAGMGDVVTTTVYLTDLSTFKEMNEVYAAFFVPPYPARATVGVAELPRGVAIEISAMAILPQ